MSDLPVEAFLAGYPAERQRAAYKLRDLVRRAVPDAIERVRPGWRLIGYDVPVGRRTAYFAFIAPEVEHVHLGFEYGFAIDDPNGILRGESLRKVRFVTIVSGDEVSTPALESLAKEAANLARIGRAERTARILDGPR
ncbi:MAG: DUF1801 domain-containing protein [Chloroflexota bacterium]